MNRKILDEYISYYANTHQNLNKIIKKIIRDYQINCHPRYKISSKLKYKIYKTKFSFNDNNIKLLENTNTNKKLENNNIQYLEETSIAQNLISLLPCLKIIYEKENINIKLFYNTLEDLFFRLNKNYNKTGKIFLNIDEITWLLKIFQCKIFKLGVLQFEIIDLDKDNKLISDILKKNEVSYNNQAISIHIMEKSRLTKTNIEKSFEKSNIFFNNYSSFYYCYSWILFEPMIKELGINSNIYTFSKFFNIVENIPDNTRAIERIKNNRKNTKLTKIMKNKQDKLGISLAIKK